MQFCKDCEAFLGDSNISGIRECSPLDSKVSAITGQRQTSYCFQVREWDSETCPHYTPKEDNFLTKLIKLFK